MQPINYMLDVQNPVQSAMTGLTQGMQIGQFMQAKELAEREAIQKQQMQEEISAFIYKPNKTYEDFSNMMVKYPSFTENFQKSYEVLDSGRQQGLFKTSSNVYAAIKSNRPDIAKNILETEAQGHENAGRTEDAERVRQLAKMADENPQALMTNAGWIMASSDMTKFKDILGSLDANQMLPEEIKFKQAQTAKTTAEAEKTETENLWYGDKTQAEIDNLESQVEDRKTGRVLEQQKMQLQNDQFYAKLDQDQQLAYEKLNQEERKQARAMAAAKETPIQRVERVEKAQNFADVAKNAAGTAQLAAQLVNDYKALGDATGAGVWNMARRAIPGTAEYNFSRRVEALKSQAFLISAEKMRGLGSLTESEGKKLENAIASLDLNQSTDQVARSIAEVAKYASSIGQSANKKTQMYATKGNGYSSVVVEAAKARGVSPAEMQQIANQLGIE